MTAAEILRNAAPPVDDGMIDKAIAELDVRIWEWAEALKGAHTQLRGAFANRPQRPSARLFDEEPAASLSAAAAAAHIPSPPPMPAEWTAPPSAAKSPAFDSPSPWAAPTGGHGISSSPPPANPNPAWPTEASRQDAASGGQGGVMQWPTANTGSWPTSSPSASSSASGGVQEWPTWTPTDLSQTTGQSNKATITSAPQKKGPKAKPVQEGPSPEERARKAAAEEALLSELEDAIARRVRLLRRLDPDTPIEKLIDKAKQGQAEAAQTRQAKEDKSSSSWWRRK